MSVSGTVKFESGVNDAYLEVSGFKCEYNNGAGGFIATNAIEGKFYYSNNSVLEQPTVTTVPSHSYTSGKYYDIVNGGTIPSRLTVLMANTSTNTNGNLRYGCAGNIGEISVNIGTAGHVFKIYNNFPYCNSVSTSTDDFGTQFTTFLCHCLTTESISGNPITLTVGANGTATVDKAESEQGETVTVTTTPDSGYLLNFGSLGTRIFDANDNEIFPTILTPTIFSFTMPDSAVTVNVKFISENPYTPGGTSDSETGVQGDFDNTSDNIPVPETPAINYSDSGLVRLFSPNQTQIIDFGNYLWTGLLDFDNIIKAFANPMDSLISFHKVPFAVDTGASIALKFAGLSTTVYMPPVTKQLYDLDFGTITFPKYYGSAFDYSPYSKAKIYLPYIGEIPLNIDRLIGKTIGVCYKADCYSGTLVAYVTIDGQTYIQQSGSCLLPIPVSMNNYQQFVTGGFNLLAGAISQVPQIGAGFGAMSPPVAVATTALAAVKPASDLLQSAFGKPETASSAIGGGIAGYLGIQYPYITITRPKQNLASSFNNMYGYPLNVTGYLQDYTGFVKVSDITLHNTTATMPERDEIYRLLHAGIQIYTNAAPTYTDTGQNMKLIFEKYTGRQNSVCKPLVTVLETEGAFRDYQDIVTPVIRVYGDLTNVLTNSNMVCIPRLNRRYFIDRITTNTSNSYELSLSCDVLQSFWDDFKGSLAIIERAEKQFNLELNDNLFVAEQRPLFQMLKFSKGFTTTSYILALSGNNGTGD